jgi:hypothetical protein
MIIIEAFEESSNDYVDLDMPKISIATLLYQATN